MTGLTIQLLLLLLIFRRSTKTTLVCYMIALVVPSFTVVRNLYEIRILLNLDFSSVRIYASIVFIRIM